MAMYITFNRARSEKFQDIVIYYVLLCFNGRKWLIYKKLTKWNGWMMKLC